MSKKREYLSGSAKRKIAEEKKSSDDALLEKIPKLTTIFKKTDKKK